MITIGVIVLSVWLGVSVPTSLMLGKTIAIRDSHNH